MNFDGLRVGGVELVFKKLPISKIWGYPGPNSRARGHLRTALSRRAMLRAFSMLSTTPVWIIFDSYSESSISGRMRIWLSAVTESPQFWNGPHFNILHIFHPSFCIISKNSKKFDYLEQFSSILWNSGKICEICTEKCANEAKMCKICKKSGNFDEIAQNRCEGL